ncbi:MAG TPA: RNA 2',3'-cyclic phosphodiesterase [Steroidobacteraceae bacterium]
MRLFFALWPDDEIRRQLAPTSRRLSLESQSRVDPKNYHVTLAFVGEVPAAKLAVLQQLGGSLRVPRFTVTCDSLEFWRESKVVVATAGAAPAALLDLWEKLHDAVGLPRERLRAHVTLARKVAQAPVLQAMSPVLWHATNFSLIRSDTGGVESAYTVLDTWPLLYEMGNP